MIVLRLRIVDSRLSAWRLTTLGELSEQRLRDAYPLRIERLPANWLARPAVLIRCVALVAFLAMEVGMHPRAILAFVVLRGFVRPRPIALGIPPQSGESVCQSRWRLARGKRLAKIVQGHWGLGPIKDQRCYRNLLL
jgi:hypothetical protein